MRGGSSKRFDSPMAWFILIAIDLLLSGRYYDVAVRDLVMAIGALSLGQVVGECRSQVEYLKQ